MNHYSISDWLAFKQNSLNRNESEIMENHLLECEQCLDLFLQLTGDLDLARADKFIPPRFSQNTMTYIKNGGSQLLPACRQSKTKRLLSYYVAAGIVTLMLVSSGMFQAALSKTVWTAASSAVPMTNTDNIVFTWPSRLIETSSAWTNLIQQQILNY